MIGDVDGHRKAAVLVDQRLGGELNNNQAMWLGLTLVAAPGAVTDANRERLLKAADAAYDWHKPRLRAAIAFRSGQFQAAIRLFEEHADGVEYQFMAAMTHNQLGNEEQARKLLKQGNDWIDRQRQKDPDNVVPHPHWQQWAYYLMMQREAESLINGKQRERSPSPTDPAPVVAPTPKN